MIRVTTTLVLALFASACSGDGTTPESRKRARAVWNERCVNCHGPTGMGDGPNAKNLAVAPRRLNDPFWQRSVTDEHLATVIVGGGQAVGKSTLMAPNQDLKDEPEVVHALVQIVRDL